MLWLLRFLKGEKKYDEAKSIFKKGSDNGQQFCFGVCSPLFFSTANFSSDRIKENIEILNQLLEFQKGDNAYYEAQLKYCNFYLEYSGDKFDKKNKKYNWWFN